MAVTRYRPRYASLSPWQELDELSSQFNRMFGGLGEGTTDTAAWVPPVNVEETADELILSAELPGMSEEDVEIELENNILTLRGEKNVVREEKADDTRVHLVERRFGQFQRSFTLPRTVKAEDISAHFDNGLLHIHMPKASESKGRKIQIRKEKS
ncbi:MAG: Hsp20/alpha crystallin family protein [Gemmatimonadota bacterium]